MKKQLTFALAATIAASETVSGAMYSPSAKARATTTVGVMSVCMVSRCA